MSEWISVEDRLPDAPGIIWYAQASITGTEVALMRMRSAKTD